MDIRTGKTYETREDAVADGVPESDVARVVKTPAGPIPRFRARVRAPTNKKHPVPHQGKREMARRMKQL